MPIPTAQERIGTVLAERYEFTSILARGGMGVLFEGRDLRTERPVVIKLLRTADLDDEERRARFLQEARSICRVRHPNVVDVLDCGEADSLPYLVMELLHGQPLSELLAERGTLGLEQTLDLLLPIMGAAAHVHDAGIVHRDLKPSNIFLHQDPAGRTLPKLLDFGIAKGTDTRGLTTSGVVLGTPEYMSPEQAGGDGVDARSDVWAMGVILHRCLTGALPFEAERPAVLLARIVNERVPSLATSAPTVPRRLAAAIDRALEPSPAARYSHMRELARALTITASSAGVHLPSMPDPVGLPSFAQWREARGSGALTDESVVPEASAPEPVLAGSTPRLHRTLVGVAVAALVLTLATIVATLHGGSVADVPPPEAAPPAAAATAARWTPAPPTTAAARAGVTPRTDLAPEPARMPPPADPASEDTPATSTPAAPRRSSPRRSARAPARATAAPPSSPSDEPVSPPLTPDREPATPSATLPELRTQW